MIIIDEAAEEHLERMLNKLEAAPGLTRCIHFDYSALKTLQPEARQTQLHATLVNLANEGLGDADMQLFNCQDGDIFLLVTDLPGKKARSLLEALANQFGIANWQAIAALYQLAQQMKALRYHVEAKLKKIQVNEAALLNRQAKEQQTRTRQAILNPNLMQQSEDSIGIRRRQRNTPELMLIEDDVFSSRLVSNALQRQYHLTILDDAYMALHTYARLAPDMLFLDIGLPNVTGHELLERILTLDPDACVVMLSGSADRANIMRAMEKGAKGFIAKPFTREKIMQYIERCPSIKRHGENHEGSRR